ncbi:hypothetical protein N431DRAFT_433531 [Stipitochalara longipes BDJ]|nr:hypothetical protein N431DRAFT_433531 [Stipitochalara longipes BDJ]
MSTKEEEARNAAREAEEGDDHVLPVYSALPTEGPTADSPFDFPSEDPPPAFAPTASSGSASTSAGPQLQRPIAIPQITPDKTEPFLSAYAQALLQYGITPESWRAFLNTMSAFLAAKVSDQAVSHAADIGRHVTNVPKRFGQHTAGHAKHIGHSIRNSAKSGDYVGAAMGVVHGTIMLPVTTALRAVGATLSLPMTAINAAAKKPLTPRERATAYAAAANDKWLSMRGLQAQLVDTAELARTVGLPMTRLLNLARTGSDRSAVGQIEALKEYICELEISEGSTFDLEASTLWLMISKEGGAAPVPTPTSAGDVKG